MEHPTGSPAASDRLEAWLEKEKKNGLLELTAYPGQDREIGHDDAARVIMAMIEASEEAETVTHEI